MLIELRIQVRPDVPAPSAAAVLFSVAIGAVKATRVSRVPSAATASWTPGGARGAACAVVRMTVGTGHATS